MTAANSHPLLTDIFRWIEQLLPGSAFGPGELDRLAVAISARFVATDAQFDTWVRGADLGVDKVRFEGDGDFPEPDAPDAVLDCLRMGKINFTHTTLNGDSVELRFEDESAGTRMWLGLAGYVIPRMMLGRFVMVDEVDSSLHPKLSAALIQLFKDPLINKLGSQLVFTSHDVSLLGNLIDDGVLDRDEVWFTEKDRAGSTTLFPLTDFQPRRGENFERAYLQGRYGAVPYVDVDELRGLFGDRAAG